MEGYQGWFASIGSIFLAAARRVFFATRLVCVFFNGVPTKKGAPLVPIFALPTDLHESSRVGA